MQTTSRGLALSACLLLVAVASFGNVAAAPNEILARTFVSFDGSIQVTTDFPNGSGIYDPANPGNTCGPVFHGARLGGAAFYFAQGRIHTNFNKHLAEIKPFGPGAISVFGPFNCPDAFESVPKGADKHVMIAGVNVELGPHIQMDSLLCQQKPATHTCFPTGPVDWDLYACPVAIGGVKNAAFGGPGYIADGKGLLTGVEALALTKIMSRTITCPTGATHFHDVSFYVNRDPTNSGADFVSSGFYGPSTGHIVHPGWGDSWVISCVSVNVTQVTPIVLVPGVAEGYDWSLVLDRANPQTWAASIANVFDPLDPIIAKGLYDLGGHTGPGGPKPYDGACPLAETACPLEPEKNTGLKPLPNPACSPPGLVPAGIALGACMDKIDNDGDGLTDFPADPGCTGPLDPVE